jgi:hypothetical protein
MEEDYFEKNIGILESSNKSSKRTFFALVAIGILAIVHSLYTGLPKLDAIATIESGFGLFTSTLAIIPYGKRIKRKSQIVMYEYHIVVLGESDQEFRQATRKDIIAGKFQLN